MTWGFNPFTGQLDKVGSSPWIEVSDSIPASSSKTVDSILNSSFESIKYLFTAFNSTNSAYESLEINVLNNGGSYKETISGKLKAGGLNIDIDTNNNSGTFELIITNNESFEVQARLARLLLV